LSATLRRAGIEDLPALAALNLRLHELHVAGAPERYRRVGVVELEAHLRSMLAREDVEIGLLGEGAGYIVIIVQDRAESPLTFGARVLYVDQLGVHPDRRGVGAGRALMDWAAERARALGCVRIELDVAGFNEEARGFYEALGYRLRQTRFECVLL